MVSFIKTLRKNGKFDEKEKENKIIPISKVFLYECGSHFML